MSRVHPNTSLNWADCAVNGTIPFQKPSFLHFCWIYSWLNFFFSFYLLITFYLFFFSYEDNRCHFALPLQFLSKRQKSLFFFILQETNIAIQAQSQNNHMLINREQNSNLDFLPKWEKFQQTMVGKEHVKNYKQEVLADCSVMCYNVKYVRY